MALVFALIGVALVLFVTEAIPSEITAIGILVALASLQPWTGVRASEAIHVPRRFFFVYLFVVVLSFGIVWELFEIGLDIIADETGLTMPLAQHGLDDTVRDTMFNSLGALLVARFGKVHLTDVAETVRGRVFTGGAQPSDRAK